MIQLTLFKSKRQAVDSGKLIGPLTNYVEECRHIIELQSLKVLNGKTTLIRACRHSIPRQHYTLYLSRHSALGR
jgi:hypothetical protein